MMVSLCRPSIETGVAMTNPEQNLQNLGLKLPLVGDAKGTYVHWRRVGSLVFMAGKGPRLEDGSVVAGRLGENIDLTQGYEASRLAGLHLLAHLKQAVGDLSCVVSVVKVLGMVNSTADFTAQTQVINGCSDLFLSVFGAERGNHARSAVGMASLPEGMPVEIEAIFEVSQPG